MRPQLTMLSILRKYARIKLQDLSWRFQSLVIQQQSFFAGSLIFIAKIHREATPNKVVFSQASLELCTCKGIDLAKIGQHGYLTVAVVEMLAGLSFGSVTRLI